MPTLVLQDYNLVSRVELCLVERVGDGHLDHLAFFDNICRTNGHDAELLRRHHDLLLLAPRVLDQLPKRLVIFRH